MTLGLGQILRGSRGTSKVLTVLKAPTIYKSRYSQALRAKQDSTFRPLDVLNIIQLTTGSAVVKTAGTDLEKVALRREYNNYQTPEFASSPYIRSIYGKGSDVFTPLVYGPLALRLVLRLGYTVR
jgi:hypothetical protein